MGSVIDYIDCPNCKHEAYDDFNYKTGEEYTNCSNCGYHYSATIINRGKKMSELTKEDWEVKEIKQPYGAYRYKMSGEVATTCGTLATEQDANNFKVEMKLEYKDHVDFATISRAIDGKIVIEHVVEEKCNT
jgi:hypothetical protein